MLTRSGIPHRGSTNFSQSFTESLLYIFNEFSERKALVDPELNYSLLFSDIKSHVISLKAVLLSRGVSKGTMLALICGNSIEFLLVCLSAIDIGAIVIPINPAYKEYELKKYLRDIDVHMIIVETSNTVKIKQCISDGTRILLLEQITTEMKYLGRKTNDIVKSKVASSDTAFIFYSSGTTGSPKAIRLSHRSLIAHLNQIELVMNSADNDFQVLTSSDIVHGVLPYFHAGGLITVFLVLAQGAMVVINRKWDEEIFLTILQRYKVTTINIVPRILDFLSEHTAVDLYDLSHLKTVFVGADKCDSKQIISVRKRIKGIQDIVQVFGMTEAGVLLIMTPRNNTKLASVGLPLPGVDVKVSDSFGGQVGIDCTGELLIRSSTIMQGYAGKDDLRSDDWFNTGDLARIDSDGFLYIEGRTKEMIKVRGWQVNPYEIEEAIKTNVPGVIDCVVVGINWKGDGQRPKALVTGSTDSEKVFAYVKANFISYKHLVEVVMVDSIPRTPTGKVIRTQRI